MRPAPRGGRQVVRVHDDVDEGVQDAPEGDVPSGEEPHRRPHVQGHQKVVGDVQEGHLQVRGDRDSGFFIKKPGKPCLESHFFLWKGEIHCKKYGFKTFRSLKAFAMRKTYCEKTCKLYWFWKGNWYSYSFQSCTWFCFFLSTKKMVSRNSTNLEKK